MRKVLPMSEIAPMIEEAIKDGGEFRLITAGTSMLPMLRDRRDTVILRKADKLKKYDLPLYKRADGSFVLHRIVGVGPEGYKLSGDNHPQIEYPVTDEQIIAVVTGFVRNGKEISTNAPIYKLYCRIWCNIVKPLREIRRKRAVQK